MTPCSSCSNPLVCSDLGNCYIHSPQFKVPLAMTPTPRTDAEILQVPSCFENTYYHVVLANFARQLERENAELLAALESMVAANSGVDVMPTIKARNQNAALMKANAAIAKVKGVQP